MSGQTPSDSASEKRKLRKRLLALRDGLSPERRAADSAKICERLCGLAAYRQARTVALFAAFRSEVDLDPAIERALAEGKRVLLPITILAERKLRFYAVDSLSGLLRGAYDIREPDPRKGPLVPYEEIELVVTPGAGFDESGGRIGYGGGFYDAVLDATAGKAPAAAVAFDCQIVDQVPAETHDRPVDLIVTPTRLIEARRKRG